MLDTILDDLDVVFDRDGLLHLVMKCNSFDTTFKEGVELYVKLSNDESS